MFSIPVLSIIKNFSQYLPGATSPCRNSYMPLAIWLLLYVGSTNSIFLVSFDAQVIIKSKTRCLGESPSSGSGKLFNHPACMHKLAVDSPEYTPELLRKTCHSQVRLNSAVRDLPRILHPHRDVISSSTGRGLSNRRHLSLLSDFRIVASVYITHARITCAAHFHQYFLRPLFGRQMDGVLNGRILPSRS